MKKKYFDPEIEFEKIILLESISKLSLGGSDIGDIGDEGGDGDDFEHLFG